MMREVRAVMADQVDGRLPVKCLSDVLFSEARFVMVDQEGGREPVSGLDEMLSCVRAVREDQAEGKELVNPLLLMSTDWRETRVE